MLFNSFSFVIFFVVVTVLYFVAPHRLRWVLLLAASCFFYMFWKPEYILILAFIITVDYCAGLLIERQPDKALKKKYLIISIVANIGLLAVFKYFNFINANITGLASLFGTTNPTPLLRLVLPIGLSFHTFQSISYTIEVYRGNQKAERHFGIYALYVMFYPQLVAGPIERPQNMLHQFHEKKYFNYNRVISGLQLMLWGMFKKTVIADRLAGVADPILNHPNGYHPSAILISIFFFSFQIYCDFSGYSDIAIGAAKVMGFDLMKNFDRPYNSKTIAEFWRRWHISLSTWFRDYLYIPLGGSRVKKGRMYINLFFVFVVSGLWHGANWTFVIWGGIHACYMIFANLTTPFRDKIRLASGIARIKWLDNALQKFITFSLVTIAWVFFRANSVNDALCMLKKLCNLPNDFNTREKLGVVIHNLHVSVSRFLLCIAVIAFMAIVQAIQEKQPVSAILYRQPRYVRWCVYYFMVMMVIYLGYFQNKEFIYFQF